MTQNASHAVMAQRQEARDALDDFPTPTWAARALCEWIRAQDPRLGDKSVWEPACNRGFMVRALREYFEFVMASDVHDYGWQHGVDDFLFPGLDQHEADWIVTNPPFRLAEEFARTALARARCGVALLVRTSFLEGVGRHNRLFIPRPPHTVLQFAERVPMVKGRCDPKASTATSYCWMVWKIRPLPPGASYTTRMAWIPPCRAALERPGDYEPLI